jgi:transposase
MHTQEQTSPMSRTIQSAFRARKSENTMNAENYAAELAVDWGDKTHAFALQSAGAKIETGSVGASAESLHGWMEQLGERFKGERVALAVEAGRNALMHALLAYPWLVIYPVHPATSQRFREAFVPSGAKDDLPDALVLLNILTQHRNLLRPLKPDSEETRKLHALVTARRGAVDRRTQLGNELRAVLKGFYPQALELCGDDLASPLALDLLARWPELKSLQAARPSTLRDFYFAHNVRRPDVVASRIERIAGARALTADPAVIQPAVLQVQLFVAVLRPMQKHIAVLDDHIAEAFAAHPDAAIFRSLPGAGPAFAPRLLVGFGADRSRYPEAASIQKFSGIAPVTVRSGSQLWIHWRWNAPVFLRQTFVEWAGQTVVHCAWAKAFYRQQRKAGKRHQAALRALAFKWIRIVWRCWQTRIPYNEATYIDALARRHSPIINTLSDS